MVIRKVLLFLVSLMASISIYSQVAIKTNVAMDALAMPNIGLEIGLGKKYSLDIPVYYNPWDQVMWQNDDKKLFRLFMVQPEFRYWLCDKFNGHFFGLHGMAGAYNTTGIDLPFTPFDNLGDYRYKGEFYGGGISYGYQFILGQHWNLGLTVGLGYAYVNYKKYPCVECAEVEDKGHKNYFGPTKAALNLIYVF